MSRDRSNDLKVTTPSVAGASARTMDVQPSIFVEGGAFLRMSTDDVSRRPIGAHFSADDARRIGEWLNTRYGLTPYAAKVGEVVQILPGAERYDADEVDYPDVRRAKVIYGLDSDGEYDVEIIDGDDAGESFYVAAEFIRHADAILPEAATPVEAKTEAPAIVAGQEYRLLPGSKYMSGVPSLFSRRGVTRVKVENGPDHDGDVLVKALDGSTMSGRPTMASVDPKYLAPLTTSALSVGDRATVTGDSAVWYHSFSAGTAVTLIASKHFDFKPDGHRDGFRAMAAGGQKWNVAAADLAPLAPAAPVALKVGDVVALKPGAKTYYGGGVYFKSDVTRVKVESASSGGGDYLVRNVDGSGTTVYHAATDTQYVGRAYLGDPEPAASIATAATAPAWAVGDIAIVSSADGDSYGRFRFRLGDRVRITGDEGSRSPRAGGRAFRAETIGGYPSGIIYACALKRPEAAEEFTPEVGGTYALKADAKRSGGASVWLTAEGATRVEVVRSADEDGDLWVRALDGSRAGSCTYVLPSGLAPLPATPAAWAVGDVAVLGETYDGTPAGTSLRVTRVEPSLSDHGSQMIYADRLDGGRRINGVFSRRLRRPDAERAWAVGDEAIVLTDRPHSAQFYAGDRVRIVSIEGETIGAKFVSGRGSRTPAYRTSPWYVSPASLRRP
ncbi:hypothetical protein ACPXB5_11210 [Micromonospora arida]|uniref:hypothetical protein n=1 Tax=Micromonospora arida TaxID=2203715 RepID=UPI003CF8A675